MTNSKRLKLANRVSRRVQNWYGKGLDRAKMIDRQVERAADRLKALKGGEKLCQLERG